MGRTKRLRDEDDFILVDPREQDCSDMSNTDDESDSGGNIGEERSIPSCCLRLSIDCTDR